MEGDTEQASYYAHHPKQRLTVRFKPQGISIRPSGRGDWNLAMTSASAGEGSMISTHGTRAEYRHPDGLVEWFENRAEGIEHGFTVARPPGGAKEGLSLTVKLAGMTPEAAGESSDLLLRSADGVARLCYSGLKVWDAEGDALPATMQASGSDILIAVNDHGATYPVTVDPVITTYREKIEMAEPGLGDSHNQFGRALAFDGETALVGVPEDNTLSGEHSGSVYVFRRNGGAWVQEAWLTPSDDGGIGYKTFGAAVVLQGDTAFIGAPGFVAGGDTTAMRGGVHVFTHTGSTWTLRTVIAGAEGTAREDFGWSLAVSGTTLLVGAPGDTAYFPSNTDLHGSAFVFEKSGESWNQTAKLIAPDGADQDLFGAAVALDGDRAIVSAPDDDEGGGMMEGSVHAFTKSAGNWSHVQMIRATGTGYNAAFGSAIALEGDTLLVGAPLADGPGRAYEGGVFEFTASGGSWSMKGRLSPAMDGVIGFGRSVLLNGGQAIVGAPGWELYSPSPAGSVHFFQRSGNAWSESEPLLAPNGYQGDTFGFPLVLGGQNLLVGMGSAGSYANYTINGAECVHVFSGSGGTWQPEAVLRPTDGGDQSYLGTAVAIDGDRCVIGLPYDDSGVNDYRGGSAYILSRESGSWTLESRLSDLGDPGAIEFGLAVAIEGDLVVVGSEEGAFAYRHDGETWGLEESFTPSVRVADDKFGAAVAISQGRVAVGAPFIHYRSFSSDGKVFVFARNGESEWQQIALLEANETYPSYPPYRSGDSFGHALDFDGDRLLIGAPSRYATSNQGRAFLFVEKNGAWEKEARVLGAEDEHSDRFGAAVALDGDGMLIGAPRDERAYFFRHEGSEWALQQTLTSPEAGFESRFGSAVALEGKLAVVGAPQFFAEYNNSAPIVPGSVHLFEMEDGSWSEQITLHGDVSTGDAFGFSMAMDGNSLLVGAPWDDFLSSPTTGNISPDQGSAYFFEIGSGIPVLLRHFDGDDDGALSLDEWSAIYPALVKRETAFPVIDADESGMLDEAELRAARNMKAVAKTLGLWADRAEAFIELDTDQDGIVTRSEIAAMWLPGASAKSIDSAWKRLEVPEGFDFTSWIQARTLPSLSSFEKGKDLRKERRVLFRMLDGDQDGVVSRDEFSNLFPFSTRSKTIETAWRVATGTTKKETPPDSMTRLEFIESTKVPTPHWE
ncbi:EF-hand domain-containing protein [Luteolibacter soli]|uniref:EF-hand domain-containing protein n=1 Tax=Luteolibacter soli TaxID=3135280 RepID=A0ABU9AR90_9BACT